MNTIARSASVAVVAFGLGFLSQDFHSFHTAEPLRFEASQGALVVTPPEQDGFLMAFGTVADGGQDGNVHLEQGQVFAAGKLQVVADKLEAAPCNCTPVDLPDSLSLCFSVVDDTRARPSEQGALPRTCVTYKVTEPDLPTGPSPVMPTAEVPRTVPEP